MNWKRRMKLFSTILGTLLGLLTYGFLNFDQKWELGPALLSVIVGVILSLCIHTISKFLDKKIGWKKNTGFRMLAGILSKIIVSTFVVKIIFHELGHQDFIKFIILVVAYSLLYTVAYFIFFSYHEFAKGQIQRQEFETKQAQLQLEALKSQLSPHFLFNSLNALSALFNKNVKSAETFIRSLGKSYKYVLEQYEHPLVTVAKEIDFTKSYFEMMKIRYGNSLKLSIDLEEGLLHTFVPPLSLQMIVENAVKHNRTDQEAPLHIVINGGNEFLKVSNNRLPKSSHVKSTRVGLKNISDRFELLNGKTIKVEESDLFSVQIPIIR